MALRLSALCLSLLCGWLGAASADEEVVVAINPAAPVGQAIGRNTLSAIFGMRLRTWENGTPIRVFVLPDDHAVHVIFTKHILRIFPHQLRTAWDRLVYSGTGQAPVEVANEEEMRASVASVGDAPVVVGNEEEMRERLAAESSAIGYLTMKMIDEHVKALPVQ